MSFIFTFVISILNLMTSIIGWITIERKIKLQYLIKHSKRMKKSGKKKRTTRSLQAKR